MTIRQMISPNKMSRGNWKPDIIVCHISEGYYQTGCEWLCNPASKVSAHFMVSQKGEITQLVSLQDAAWGNGTTAATSANSTLEAVRSRKVNANLYTISIDHEGFYAKTQGALTPAQQAAAVELIGFIRSEVKRLYGTEIPADRQHIVGHFEISPKAKPHCPGEKFPFDAIIKEVNAVEAKKVFEEDVKQVQEKLGLSDATIVYLKAYPYAVPLFAKLAAALK